MYKTKYNYKRNSPMQYVKVIITICTFIFLLGFTIYVSYNPDKIDYQNYKKYEVNIDKSYQLIINNAEKYTNDYYLNKISKRQIISYLDKTSSDLRKLYDNFNYNKGDEITKELFVIKKQIIITHAQIYSDRAKAIPTGIKSNETSELAFIQSLLDRYLEKDRLEKEKFNINF